MKANGSANSSQLGSNTGHSGGGRNSPSGPGPPRGGAGRGPGGGAAAGSIAAVRRGRGRGSGLRLGDSGAGLLSLPRAPEPSSSSSSADDDGVCASHAVRLRRRGEEKESRPAPTPPPPNGRGGPARGCGRPCGPGSRCPLPVCYVPQALLSRSHIWRRRAPRVALCRWWLHPVGVTCHGGDAPPGRPQGDRQQLGRKKGVEAGKQ